MKTSNKILILCMLFYLGFVVYDKYDIKVKYDKRAENNFVVQKELDSFEFKHVVVDGANVGTVDFNNSKGFTGIVYKEDVGEFFDRVVKNDTLYITYHSELKRTNLLKKRKNRIEVKSNTVESITVKNCHSGIWLYKPSTLKVNVLYSADVLMKANGMDSLFVHVSSYSKIKFQTNKKKKVGFASLMVDTNGLIDAKALKVENVKVEKQDEGRVLLQKD